MDIPTALRHRALHLLRAWFAMLIALYVAIVAAGMTWILALAVLSPGDGGLANTLSWLGFFAVVAVIYGLMLAAIFSVLALPLLMLQRFIVRPRPPYLQPGYAGVMLYGPALLILMDGGWDRESWPLYAAYELIALVATLIYVRLDRAFALFPPKPQLQVGADLARA